MQAQALSTEEIIARIRERHRVASTQRLRHSPGDTDRHPRPQPGHRHSARPGPADAAPLQAPSPRPVGGTPETPGSPPSTAGSPSTATSSGPPTPTGAAGKAPRSPAPSAHTAPAHRPHRRARPTRRRRSGRPPRSPRPDQRRRTAPIRTLKQRSAAVSGFLCVDARRPLVVANR